MEAVIQGNPDGILHVVFLVAQFKRPDNLVSDQIG